MPRRRGRRGEGGITRRPNGRWQAQHSVTDGGIRRRETRTFDLKADAEWWLSQARRDGAPDNPSLRDYAHEWLDSRRKMAASTRAIYDVHLRKHINPVLGGYRLGDLRRRHVEVFVDGLTLAPGTVDLILRHLRAILSGAVKAGLIPTNPAANVESPAVHRAPYVAMTPEEASAIRAAVTGHWTERVIRFLLGSGCRIGEAVALDQGDVGEGFVMIRNPKNRQPRATLLSEDAQEAVAEAIWLAPRVGPKEPVFFGLSGDRITRSAVGHALTRRLSNAGLRHRNVHALRHGTASLMIAAGVHTKVVAEQLGNTERVVSQTYAHVTPTVARAAISVLDEGVRKR